MVTKLTEKEKEQMRREVAERMERQKLELYGLKQTQEESRILLEAMTELLTTGKTDIKCPRCGNNLVLNETGSSNELKCLNTEICIKIVTRGI